MKLRVPRFEASRVLVVGDVMLDRYWHGDTLRISPEAPVPVVRVGSVEERPGGAANVALNVVELGACPTVLGFTGDDAAADILTTLLARAGVDSDFQRVPGAATITKLRVISQSQQLIRLDFEDGFPGVDEEEFLDRYRHHLGSAKSVVLSDYRKGALSQVERFITESRDQQCPLLVDPKGSDFSAYRGATVLTPNRREFEATVGVCRDERALVEKGLRMVRDLQLEGLLITRGEEGMTLLARDGPPLHLPTRAREVFDVTGAGDTVISTLASGLAAGMTMADATTLANIAAGVVVGKLGTATVSVPELRRQIFEQQELLRGVISEGDLMEQLEVARQHGQRIVMTNGCFDILHAGHVTYLEQARRLGDRLIIAVNDDESVRRLKGEARPVNSQEQRMDVLAGLGAVDWVVPFSEDTPERLICRVKPEFLVKGGDNDPATIPGNRCVWEAGGEVVVMDYVDDTSTTGIIARIRKQGDDPAP